jgi:hypothetical protein
MASCFCWSVNRRRVLVGLVIDGQSECHGLTPIDLSTKPGQSHRVFLVIREAKLLAAHHPGPGLRSQGHCPAKGQGFPEFPKLLKPKKPFSAQILHS